MVVGETSVRGSGAPLQQVADAELRRRYEAYCRRQASRLVQLMPREAVRPLYRRARDEARRADALADGGETDPLTLLVRYCRGLLPLPPFEVWREDLRRYPEGHFTDLEESADVPTADAPSTMEVRSLEARGRRWLAHLRSFREAGLWRGYISFEEEGSGRAHRTAAVFCEADAAALRERFLSFEAAALEAFLRSALP
jgi:hypothetical protein